MLARGLQNNCARAIASLSLAWTVSGCATSPYSADYVSGMTGRPAGTPAKDACRNFAEEQEAALPSGPFEADPSANQQLGSAIGNAIGSSAVKRRLYGECMREAGYVRSSRR